MGVGGLSEGRRREGEGVGGKGASVMREGDKGMAVGDYQMRRLEMRKLSYIFSVNTART